MARAYRIDFTISRLLESRRIVEAEVHTSLKGYIPILAKAERREATLTGRNHGESKDL